MTVPCTLLTGKCTNYKESENQLGSEGGNVGDGRGEKKDGPHYHNHDPSSGLCEPFPLSASCKECFELMGISV